MNGTMNGSKHNHTISQAFVFLLLAVFAMLSTLMVLLSAQLYRGTVAQTERTGDKRVLSSYITNVVRGNDGAGMVHVDERAGVRMLVFDWEDSGEHYETMVYCHDGYLRELFADVRQEFDPEYGEEICAARAFEPALQDGLLEIRLEDEYGQESVLRLALRCGQEVNHG